MTAADWPEAFWQKVPAQKCLDPDDEQGTRKANSNRLSTFAAAIGAHPGRSRQLFCSPTETRLADRLLCIKWKWPASK